MKNSIALSPAVATFYGVMGGAMALAIAFTLYQGSLFLFHAQKLSALEAQRHELTVRQQALQVEVAQSTSLAAVQPQLESDYQTIAKPVIVKLNTAVAVR